MPKQPYINTFEDPALRRATVKEIKNTVPASGDLKQVKTTSNLKNSKIIKSGSEKSTTDNGVTTISNTDVERIVTTPDGTVIVVTTDKDVYVNTFEDVTEQKYVSNITGDSAALEIGTVVGATYTSVIDGVCKIGFDSNGFDVTNLGDGLAKIGINSTFKFWQINGLQGLVACGLDTVNFIPGCNITITADEMASPKTFTISSCGGGGGAELDSYCSFHVGNGLENSTGYNNIAIGYNTIYANTIGSNNIGIGLNALCSNVSGSNNIGIGWNTLTKLVDGLDNTVFGKCVAPNLTTGTQNIVIGNNLTLGLIGYCNIAIGKSNLNRGTASCNNIAIGNSNLYGRVTSIGCAITDPGNNNIAIGNCVLYRACGSNQNIGLGSGALYCATTGGTNIGIGRCALYCNREGSGNIAIGIDAGKFVSGNNNTVIGGLQANNTINDTVLIGAGVCERIKVDSVGLYINCVYYDPTPPVPSSNIWLNQYCSFVVNCSEANSVTTSNTDNIIIGYCAFPCIGYYSCQGCGACRNVVLGNYALNTSCNMADSVAIGYGAMRFGGTDQGRGSVAVGATAGSSCSWYSTYLGFGAGEKNNGSYNVYLGYMSGNSSCCGNSNVFIGNCTGAFSRCSFSNIFIGELTGVQVGWFSPVQQRFNIAIGTAALTGYGSRRVNCNIAIGYAALQCYRGPATGETPGNIAIGYCTANQLCIGYSNIFIGDCAGVCQVGGCNNTVIGSIDTCVYNCLNPCNTVFIGSGSCIRLKINDYGLEINCTPLSTIISCSVGFRGFTPCSGSDMSLGAGSLTYNCYSCVVSYNRNLAIGNGSMGIVPGNGSVTDNISIGLTALHTLGNYYGYCGGGNNNIVLGQCALHYMTTGSHNIFIGNCAGYLLSQGCNNTIIGNGFYAIYPQPVYCIYDTLLIGTGCNCERLRVNNTGLYINCVSFGVGDGLCSTSLGYRISTPNIKSTDYVLVASDSGGLIIHPSTDANARTFTIPANSSVPYPVGTEIKFSNETIQVVTIAINSDTLILTGAGTTGSRTLAQFGFATAIKVGATKWYISGSGLT